MKQKNIPGLDIDRGGRSWPRVTDVCFSLPRVLRTSVLAAFEGAQRTCTPRRPGSWVTSS